MIKIVKAKQTSLACPSQWDAWDDAGTYYYLRYRWGHGTLNRGEIWGPLVAEFSSGDSMDGVISLAEFAGLVGLDVSTAEISGFADDWLFDAEYACHACGQELIAPWQTCPACGKK